MFSDVGLGLGLILKLTDLMGRYVSIAIHELTSPLQFLFLSLAMAVMRRISNVQSFIESSQAGQGFREII